MTLESDVKSVQKPASRSVTRQQYKEACGSIRQWIKDRVHAQDTLDMYEVTLHAVLGNTYAGVGNDEPGFWAAVTFLDTHYTYDPLADRADGWTQLPSGMMVWEFHTEKELYNLSRRYQRKYDRFPPDVY